MEELLRTILRLPDTVLFIGSGVSTWSGLPTWSKLIEELAVFLASKGHDPSLVRQEANRGELLQAASYGFDKLTTQQIGEFIRQACRIGKAKPHEIHHKIVSLGPRCFVTTNYDHLLEKSFQEWQPEHYYRKVINRQLTETADICGVRSTNFLFKLHGDAEDVDSIILTREQYRKCVVSGALYHAFEAVRILQASRPFVYIGFGLRDPDFLYVRDLLANTFKGGARDHYAIMANVSETEKDYWRRNYGIHLLNYPTLPGPDGLSDHGALITLLDRLCLKPSPTAQVIQSITLEPESPILVLALARHAARLSRIEMPPVLIPLKIQSEENVRGHNSALTSKLKQYNYNSVEMLLDDGPDRFILIGDPGAGKSFAVRHSAARLAEKLYESCFADSFNPEGVVVPLIVDLRLYKGDVWSLVEKTLPTGLSFADLISNLHVKIYLDAFNEMPREYIEKGEWEADFNNFFKNTPQASIIITSRTNDGLSKLDIPVFSVDSVDMDFVDNHLAKSGLNIKGLFEHEVLAILRRPFFFQLAFKGSLDLQKVKQPSDIFNSFLSHLTSDCIAQFGANFKVMTPLSALAKESMDQGEEAIPVATAISIIQAELMTEGITAFNAKDVLNWLVGQNFFLPLSGGRLAFFHQLITEYLAATELARIYVVSPNILQEKLSLRRWDQTLFLTLSLLPEEQAEKFLDAVIAMDFILALLAVKHMESGSEKIVERLLREIPTKVKIDFRLGLEISLALMSELPISLCHESLLRDLIKLANHLGGSAAAALVTLRGDDVKDEMFDLLIENCTDNNFCIYLSDALRPLISNKDITRLVDLSDRAQKRFATKRSKDYDGFDYALGVMLSELETRAVYDGFIDCNKTLKKQAVRLDILCKYLRENGSNEAFEVASELLLVGVAEAAFCVLIIAMQSEVVLNWSIFKDSHIKRLIELVKNVGTDSGNWGLDALRYIYGKRPDLVPLVLEADGASVIFRAALIYATVVDENYKPVFDSLEELCNLKPEQLEKEPLELISHLELSWFGFEDLFVRLLRLRNIKLATQLARTVTATGFIDQIGILEIGPIDWWLEWSKEAQKNDDGWWFNNSLASLFANMMPSEFLNSFVTEFNKQDSPYRGVLANFFLPASKELYSEQLCEDAISFLLADLSTRQFSDFRGHLLGKIATEEFVIERLLPLLQTTEEPLHGNLLRVLQQAGKRHGKRYIRI